MHFAQRPSAITCMLRVQCVKLFHLQCRALWLKLALQNMEPNPKYAKVGAITGKVSVKRVCDVLHAFKPDTVEEEELDSARQIKRLVDKTTKDVADKYCFCVNIAAYIPEQGVECWFTDLAAALQMKANQCMGFAKLLEATIRKHPTGLTLIAYHDEATPGNVLQPDNQRKATLLYISFLEFYQFNRTEHAWTTCGVLRHTSCVQISGGLSAWFRQYLLSMLPPRGKLLHEGEALILPGGTVLVTIRKVKFFADEAALKATLGSKGASGKKPCHKCVNLVFKPEMEKQPADQTFFCSFEAAPHQLVALDAVGVYETVDYLASLRGKSQLDAEETLMGFNDLPEGLLQDTSLRRIIGPDDVYFGPMHVYLSNGIANDEVHLFFWHLKENTSQFQLDHFIQFATSAWEGQSPCRRKEAFRRKLFRQDGYAGSAINLSLVLPMLAMFAQEVVMKACHEEGYAGPAPGLLQPAVDSLLALASVLVELRRLKSASLTTVDVTRLKAAQLHFREKHINCYGIDHLKPKFHMQFHLPSQILESQFVLDEFPVETKHILYKHYVAFHQKTFQSYDRACLTRMLLAETSLMNKFLQGAGTRLQGKIAVDPNFGLPASANFCVGGRSWRQNDVVVAAHVGYKLVAAMASDKHGVVVMVESLALVAYLPSLFSVAFGFCRCICNFCLVRSSSKKVVDAVWTQVWQKSGEHVILKATGMLDPPSQLKLFFCLRLVFVLLPCCFWCVYIYICGFALKLSTCKLRTLACTRLLLGQRMQTTFW